MVTDRKPVAASLWLFVVLAFGISWIGFAVRQSTSWPSAIDEALRLLVKFGPSLAGVVAVAALAGMPGVRDLLRRLVPAQRDTLWVVLALFLPIVILALAAIVRESFSAERILTPALAPMSAMNVYGALLATRFFLGGGLGEELGWRGFLQPQLQARCSPLRTSVIIGVLHGVWHLPAYGIGIVLLTGFTLSMAIVATWIFSNTNGRLFPIVLLHANGNATLAFVEDLFPQLDNDAGFLLMVFVLWLAAAGLIVWRVDLFKQEHGREARSED